MPSIEPVTQALIPVDSDAAQRIIGPNYDEFQSDAEIWRFLQQQPDSILRVTMAHCDTDTPEEIGDEGSAAALSRSAELLEELKQSSLTSTIENVLWVYEILDPRRPGLRQIGLGGAAHTDQIRTEHTPDGRIIRNEGVRPAKASGRARLIEATKSYIGIVNNTVEDRDGTFAGLLEQIADSRPASFSADDEHGNTHRIWLIKAAEEIQQLQSSLLAQGEAYVADGNHRSAAAAELGLERFLAVFFPASRMGLAPYNRLLKVNPLSDADLMARLTEHFEVKELGDRQGFAPQDVHTIGLYSGSGWFELNVRPEVLAQADAAGKIDAAILQRYVFEPLFGIADAADGRFNYVGGNKDSEYLKQQVDSGRYEYAFSLAPVRMEQFIAVCRAQQFMPPKSTWFEPKVRSGLLIALLPPI